MISHILLWRLFVGQPASQLEGKQAGKANRRADSSTSSSQSMLFQVRLSTIANLTRAVKDSRASSGCPEPVGRALIVELVSRSRLAQADDGEQKRATASGRMKEISRQNFLISVFQSSPWQTHLPPPSCTVRADWRRTITG
jgi:hypothetical protein